MKRNILCALLFLWYHLGVGRGDEDCLSGSLDGLNLAALLKESTKSVSCFIEARKTFTQKYANTTVIIKGPFTTNEESGIDESKPFIVEMNHYESIRAIFKTFGDSISSICLIFDYMNEVKGREIVGDINENCTKSLLQMEFTNCYGTVLNMLNNSFPNVYIVSLSTDKYQDLKNVSLHLSKLFPKLVHLKLTISNVKYWKIVGDKFPYLKSLLIDFPPESARPDIESLLENSPNIDSLHISYSTLNILRAASDFLPMLKSLVLQNFFNDAYDGKRIHFKSVKYLILTSEQDSNPIPRYLVFYELQFLELSLGHDFTNDWIIFFMKQKGHTLEYLDLLADSFNCEQLSAIVDNQPNIKWTMIQSRTEIAADAIINFVEKSSNLFGFQLDGRLNNIAERNKLEEQLESNWNVDFYYNSNSFVVSLTRLSNITEPDDNAGTSLLAGPILIISSFLVLTSTK